MATMQKCFYCDCWDEEWCEDCGGCPECCESEYHCADCGNPPLLCPCVQPITLVNRDGDVLPFTYP